MTSSTTAPSGLHIQAASDHEAAAQHHRKAAECYDHNKTSEAQSASRNAMECCNTAQKNTATACECSVK